MFNTVTTDLVWLKCSKKNVVKQLKTTVVIATIKLELQQECG